MVEGRHEDFFCNIHWWLSQNCHLWLMLNKFIFKSQLILSYPSVSNISFTARPDKSQEESHSSDRPFLTPVCSHSERGFPYTGVREDELTFKNWTGSSKGVALLSSSAPTDDKKFAFLLIIHCSGNGIEKRNFKLTAPSSDKSFRSEQVALDINIKWWYLRRFTQRRCMKV